MRWQYWQFNLIILLLLVIILIPWYQVYVFLRQDRGWKQKTSLYITTFFWFIYLYLFNMANTIIESDKQNDKQYSWMEIGIFRVSVIGITITSILSGFGVVNTSYTTWLTYTQHVSESEYIVAQQAYENIISSIREKKSTLISLKETQIQSSTRNHQKPQSMFDRFFTSLVGGNIQEESKLLEIEIQQLESLSLNMKSDLDELNRGRLRSQYSKTWRGKFQNSTNFIFTIYCLYKMLVTSLNVLLQRTGSGDPISNTLSLMLSHFGNDTNIDTKFWAQQLSFWFAGIIVFGSVRGLFNLLSKILRSFSHRISISTSNILLFIAHMMGMYFLSSVLMMQINLPPNYRYLISSTLGQIEFTFFQRWSDIIFVISSLATLAILYVLHQTKDAKSLATDYADMQQLSLEGGMSMNSKYLN
ncbi:unnamed protein product [Cunninghamella blakesleeana]